jgi:hypothetical protein
MSSCLGAHALSYSRMSRVQMLHAFSYSRINSHVYHDQACLLDFSSLPFAVVLCCPVLTSSSDITCVLVSSHTVWSHVYARPFFCLLEFSSCRISDVVYLCCLLWTSLRRITCISSLVGHKLTSHFIFSNSNSTVIHSCLTYIYIYHIFQLQPCTQTFNFDLSKYKCTLFIPQYFTQD